jgi:ElaB/YqjD/DUF883 family membrane-anchored ribosome-binding protein
METTTEQKMTSDVKGFLSDAEELLKSAASATGDAAVKLREKASAKLRQASEKVADLQADLLDKGKNAARATDDYVHEHPWQAIGIAAAAGFLVGLLVNRK